MFNVIQVSLLCALAMGVMSYTASAASSFQEVRELVLDQQPAVEGEEAQEELLIYQRGDLPQYKVTIAKFVQNGINMLKAQAIQTITQHDDFFPRLPKLIHSNGVCMMGKWKITEENPYSGYFRKGSEALLMVRVSTATSNTKAGKKRGFGLAGKLFPTLNPQEKVQTANFFTVDVLTGKKSKHFMDTQLTNEPPVGFEPSLIYMLIKLSKALKAADKNPLYRQLYEVSEAGLGSAQQESKTPRWMKIAPAEGNNIVDEKDFRDELNIAKHHPNGIKFNILVSDVTKKVSSSKWVKIGQIELNESVVSYGCDRQLHFHHPKLRND